MKSSPLLLVAVAAFAVAACGRQIGDACTSNVECSSLGDRFCDVSAPQGYCTVEGCDNVSCPSGSVCIRFFTPITSRPCNPDTVATDCLRSERCMCDCGDPNRPGGCLVPTLLSSGDDGGMSSVDGGALVIGCEGTQPATDPTVKVGHCAPESSERRWCMRSCNTQNCRPGYECRASGIGGSETVPSAVNDGGVAFGALTQFCVQRAF